MLSFYLVWPGVPGGAECHSERSIGQAFRHLLSEGMWSKRARPWHKIGTSPPLARLLGRGDALSIDDVAEGSDRPSGTSKRGTALPGTRKSE